MAKQRVVKTKYWSDPYIRKLDKDGKLLFLYLFTNDKTAISGAYEITLDDICLETGIEMQKVRQLLRKFERDSKYFFKNNWMLAANFIKHQARNPKIDKGIAVALEDSPEWVKTYSMDRLSHLNLNFKPNLNSNLNPKPKEKSAATDDDPDEPPEPEPENQKTEDARSRANSPRLAHTTQIIVGITQALKVKNLPNKIEWMNAAEWAFQNDFSAEQFLECFGLMKQQKWRTGAVNPKTVTQNLPELEKLRIDVANQGKNQNGTNSTNSSKGSKRTDADVLRASAEQFRAEYGEDPA